MIDSFLAQTTFYGATGRDSTDVEVWSSPGGVGGFRTERQSKIENSMVC
jgi:hypothetical protein